MTALAWEGCVNVRDLGGLRTEDGRTIAHGAVVRADALSELSDAGWNALAGYGIRTIVDLRFHEEREADPPRDLDLDVVHVSLFGDQNVATLKEFVRALDTAADAAEYVHWAYGEWLSRYAANIAAAFCAIAEAPSGGVCIHCMAGKDRTGLVVALLLRLVGVPVDAVAADYAASEEAWRPRHDEWVAEAADEAERVRRQRLGPAPAGALAGVLADLDARYGSVADYLRAAGVPDDELDRLCARLLA